MAVQESANCMQMSKTGTGLPQKSPIEGKWMSNYTHPVGLLIQEVKTQPQEE
jgi:hypothetical protein